MMVENFRQFSLKMLRCRVRVLFMLYNMGYNRVAIAQHACALYLKIGRRVTYTLAPLTLLSQYSHSWHTEFHLMHTKTILRKYHDSQVNILCVIINIFCVIRELHHMLKLFWSCSAVYNYMLHHVCDIADVRSGTCSVPSGYTMVAHLAGQLGIRTMVEHPGGTYPWLTWNHAKPELA